MVTQTAEYALRAAVWLAQQPMLPASSASIAQATQIPRRYLHHVLQALVHAGLVCSYPGPGGGYQLARAPEAITILDIINAVSPLPRIRQCPLGLTGHGTHLCPLHRALDQATALVERAFRSVRLADLLPKKTGASALCNRDKSLSLR